MTEYPRLAETWNFGVLRQQHGVNWVPKLLSAELILELTSSFVLIFHQEEICLKGSSFWHNRIWWQWSILKARLHHCWLVTKHVGHRCTTRFGHIFCLAFHSFTSGCACSFSAVVAGENSTQKSFCSSDKTVRTSERSLRNGHSMFEEILRQAAWIKENCSHGAILIVSNKSHGSHQSQTYHKF